MIQQQLERLRVAVLEQNVPASVEGSLAHHILGSERDFLIEWNVDCYGHWLGSFNPKDIHQVAALGYSMAHQFREDCVAELETGLSNVTRRDPQSGGHLSVSNQPSILVGICLGAVAIKDYSRRPFDWCVRLLHSILNGSRETKRLDDPLYLYLGYRLLSSTIDTPQLLSKESLYVLAFYEWAVRNQVATPGYSSAALESLRKMIVQKAATRLEFQTAYQAAFIWSAVNASVFHGLQSNVISADHVAAILSRFEDAMKRWRWDEESANPVRWQIRQEREVQDVLWLILRSYFDDLVDEDTLPKFGHSSYRPDFAIPSLKLIVEVKLTRASADFKKVEKEIMEDSVGYLQNSDRYHRIIVFIYDASSSVQEHGTTRRALRQVSGIHEVVIVARPSQLQGPMD